MSIQSEQLKERTMRFALAVLAVVDTFRRSIAADAVGRQLAKSAPSVAANYRSACVARSRAEFIARLGIVVDESDESEFWLMVASRRTLGEAAELESVRREAAELRAIFARSLGTARGNAKRQ